MFSICPTLLSYCCLTILCTIIISFQEDPELFTCPTLEFSQTKVSEGTVSWGGNSFTSSTLTVTDTLVDRRGLSVRVTIKTCKTLFYFYTLTQPNVLIQHTDSLSLWPQQKWWWQWREGQGQSIIPIKMPTQVHHYTLLFFKTLEKLHFKSSVFNIHDLM